MSSKWPKCRVEDLADKIAMGPFGSNIKVETFVDAGVPIISGDHLRGMRMKDGNFNFITEEHAERLRNSVVVRGDVIFTHAGNIGQVAYIPETSKYSRYVISQRQFYARCDKNKIVPQFLAYFFHTPEGRHKLLSNASQVGVPSIARPSTHLKAIELNVPPVEYQRSVCDVISALDDRITLLRETNATLEAIAQAIFKSWFVDFEPVRAKLEGRAPEGMDEATAALFPDSFEESELGQVPKGWRVGTLGDIAHIARRQIQASDLHADIHYVGLEHIPRKSLSLTSWGNAKGLESAKTAFCEGDVLFGKLRPYFHKVVIAPFAGVCSTDILVCQPSTADYFGAVAMHLFSEALIKYADRLSNGAKMPRVNWKDLAAYPICVPQQQVAARLNDALCPMVSRMNANVHQAHTLATLRDTLLPRLISGKLRLPEAENTIAEAIA